MAEEAVGSINEARKLIEQERRDREQACMQAIAAALREHRCKLHIVQTFVDGQQAQVHIQPEAEP